MEDKITITLVPKEGGTMCKLDTNVYWGEDFEEVIGGKISIIKELLESMDFTLSEFVCLLSSIENNKKYNRLLELMEQASDMGFDLNDKKDRHNLVEWLIDRGVVVEEGK